MAGAWHGMCEIALMFFFFWSSCDVTLQFLLTSGGSYCVAIRSAHILVAALRISFGAKKKMWPTEVYRERKRDTKHALWPGCFFAKLHRNGRWAGFIYSEEMWDRLRSTFVSLCLCLSTGVPRGVVWGVHPPPPEITKF
jgi:hypothetical protein